MYVDHLICFDFYMGHQLKCVMFTTSHCCRLILLLTRTEKHFFFLTQTEFRDRIQSINRYSDADAYLAALQNAEWRGTNPLIVICWKYDDD